MEWGGVTETELMPILVVGYTELGGGKWKKGKGFSKPNFELGPNWTFYWCSLYHKKGAGWISHPQ